MTGRRTFLAGMGATLALPWSLLRFPKPKKELAQDLNQDIRRLIPAAHWHCPQCSGRRVLMGEVGSRRLRCPKCEGYNGVFVHEDPYDRFLRELRDNVKQCLEQEDGQLEKLWIDPIDSKNRRLVHLVVGGREVRWYQTYGG
jgi:hypothetical protein